MKKKFLFTITIISVFFGLFGQIKSQSVNNSFSGTIDGDMLYGNRSPQVNGTFYTQYYGVRNGNLSYFLWNPGDTAFFLLDTMAAVGVYPLGQGSTSFPQPPNPYLNSSTIWGNPPSNVYSNYILDAYWTALQYVHYLRNHFNCPKDFFQRHYTDATYGLYEVCDTTTPIFIADDAFYDNTHWFEYDASGLNSNRDQEPPCYRHTIVIGSPSAVHNPRASIDDVVHEFAHVFSKQAWHPHYSPATQYIEDNRLAEACADIWTAIITSTIYPNDENRIWKIGEDVVLANSGNSCIRNLAVPNDPTAEMQMDTCICQESDRSAYQQSGIISHWFYLLTHGYSGKGCDGNCYAFNAIPIDSAAKLMYYCEMDYFDQGMDFPDIVRATIEAAEVFSNPSLIRQSICGAWNVMGASTCGFDEFEEFGVEQHYGLSFDAVNSGDYYVGRDIVIDSLQTLNLTGTIHMNDSARIIVRPGGKLIVNGGTLTSACDGEMWQGIIVEGNKNIRQTALVQGSVILNNATIENARDAICTKGADPNTMYDHTGGIIQATNTLFRNNRRSAEFLSYENHKTNGAVANNASFFTRCTFVVDDNNLFAENDAAFGSHVTMWEVRGVKFNGCCFHNEISSAAGTARGKAIYTEKAGFIARPVCPIVSNTEPCVCEDSPNDTVTRCLFSGFNKAIHAANSNAAYDITIDNCDFRQNKTGVELNAADNACVSFCDFDLVSANTGGYGVDLNSSTGFTVEGNAFYFSSLPAPSVIGVNCKNTGSAENVIRLNTFTGLDYACYAIGTNSNGSLIKPRGLQFHCNTYSRNLYDLYVAAASDIRFSQGYYSSGADNTFFRTANSSIYVVSGILEYLYNSGGDRVPLNPSSNVSTSSSAAANSCSSTLCENPATPTPPGPLTPFQSGYTAMAGELDSLAAAFEARGYGETPGNDGEDAALVERMSGLSAAMGDLSRSAVRRILSDSVPDMELLKDWYRAIAQSETGSVPVAAYHLAEVYSTEREWAAAREALASIPVRFGMDSVEREEYGNYLALQQLRERVEGNWYRQTETEIADLQGVAERNGGRAARMAKEILCFFHSICYEDEPLVDLEGIEERNTRGGVVHRAATTAIITGTGTINLYPNPAHSTLTVESASPIREITVYDMTGHAVTVRANHHSPQRWVINTSSLHAGIYMLKVVTDSGTEAAKFVKN